MRRGGFKMSGLVIFYSFSGHTAKHASDYAKANSAELIEVKPAANLGKLKAYTVGCFKAMTGRPMPIMPIAEDLSKYTDVTAFAPVWAGGMAPCMIAALQQVSKGANVSLRLVSMSGNSSKAKNTAFVEAMGLNVVGYKDIKA
jgi:hypothetical protein